MTTNVQINRIADLLFGGVATGAAPSTYFIALSTTTPSADGTGFTEVSTVGTGYSRLSVNNNKTNLSNAANGVVLSVLEFDFPEAMSNWGTITDVGIFDASTGGTLLYNATLTTQKPISEGDVARFTVNGLQFIVQNITI